MNCCVFKLWCLALFACCLATSTQAVRCYCTGAFCMTGSGPEEECGNKLPPDIVANMSDTYKNDMQGQLMELLLMVQVGEMGPNPDMGKVKALVPAATKQAQEVIGRADTQDKLLEMRAFIAEIKGEVDAMKEAGAADPAKEKVTMQKLEALSAGKVTPAPVDYQYCVLMSGGKDGGFLRSCGVMAREALGPGIKQGCHVYTGNNKYSNYCRCEGSLCNGGSIEMLEAEEENVGVKPKASAGVRTLATAALLVLSLLVAVAGA